MIEMSRRATGWIVLLLAEVSMRLITDTGADLLSATQQQSVVNVHNADRRAVVPPAADMEIMSWDNSLADLANSWVVQCNYSHNQPDPSSTPYASIGQNIWEGSLPLTNDLTLQIQGFYNETQFYTFSSNTCQTGKVCGHYTQVVWSTSVAVGCAYKVCPNLNGFTLLVCNYGPAGNIANSNLVVQPPYQTGAACTKCAGGSGWCNNGLCTSTCTAPSSTCTCNGDCAGSCGTWNATACTCTCQPGWSGSDCSQQTCINGKTTTGSCGCQCSAGWVGPTCNQQCVNTGEMCYPFICGIEDPYWENYMQTECPLTCPGPCGPGQPVNPNYDYYES